MYFKTLFSKVSALPVSLIVESASFPLVGCNTSCVDMRGMLSSCVVFSKASSLSDEEMPHIGDHTIAHLDSSHRVASSRSIYARPLEQLTAPWQQVEGVSLEYKVYMDPEVSAFAVPSGLYSLPQCLIV